MKRQILLLISVLIALQTASAQSYETLYGKVTALDTGQSIQAASIQLEGSSISNVTNSEGAFSLKVPKGSQGRVVVTHLGYRNAYVPLLEFRGPDPGKPVQIGLLPSFFTLDPATVHAEDAARIVHDAIWSVGRNYPRTHTGMTAFYRELIRKGKIKYIVLNEAVLDIDKAPYATMARDKAAIFKGRGSLNYDTTDTLAVKFQGGVTAALAVDIAKNPFPGVYPEVVDKYYNFTLEGIDNIDERSFYVISFNQKPGGPDILYSGKLYIDTRTMAFGRAEVRLNTKGREEEASKEFIIKKPQGFRFFVEDSHYTVSYRLCEDGLWYPDYTHLFLSFSSKKKGTLFKGRFTVESEMVVTSRHETVPTIEKSETIRFNDILSSKVSDFKDDNFWGEYNVIEPDQSINQIVKKIVRQLEHSGRKENEHPRPIQNLDSIR